MSQKLILPIDKCAFSAGYKNAAYLKQQGYAHYGVDLYSEVGNTTVKAIGNGKVIAAGLDGATDSNRLGRCCVIVYQDVELHDGMVCGLACRMFHFDSLNVSAGQFVTKGDVIGQYGNTGSTLVNGQRMGKHLHIEFDTDTQYPAYAVGIKTSGNVIKKGTIDSTLDPSTVWYLGKGQTIRGIYDGWYKQEDIDLPLEEEPVEDDSTIPIAWDEDTYDTYWGNPVWKVSEKVDGEQIIKLFDKWWRKVPTDSSPNAGEFASESDKNIAKAYDPAEGVWYEDPNDPKGEASVSESKEEESTAIPIAWDEDSYESFWGEPVWSVENKGGSDGTILRLFDKWWRKVPTMDSPDAGRYATEKEKSAAKAYDPNLHAWYADPTDPKGKAGLTETGKTEPADEPDPEPAPENEIEALRRTITEYEIEKAETINTLRALIEKLEK